MNFKARAIAFYLPQYHPTPENDAFWGTGFTEWANVAKAKPLFRGHMQPRLPADLGFYDLRVPEVREQQAALARQAGIEGFCYWHYWFGSGKQTLERIFDEVVASGKPDFPFCLGWANESWTGRWHGLDSEVIFEQTYPGRDDHIRHFKKLLPAFLDKRYMHVDGKRIFLIYRPELIPDLSSFLATWDDLAKSSGFPGFFFISANSDFDHSSFPEIAGVIHRHISKAIYSTPRLWQKFWVSNRISRLFRWLSAKGASIFRNYPPIACSYRNFLDNWLKMEMKPDAFPCAFPNWDNTPRSGPNGLVIHNSNPALFREMVKHQIEGLQARPENQRFLFIKSWNEWAEGNYMEPDRENGLSYIDALREELQR